MAEHPAVWTTWRGEDDAGLVGVPSHKIDLLLGESR